MNNQETAHERFFWFKHCLDGCAMSLEYDPADERKHPLRCLVCCAMGLEYDPADDGPEVEIIRFFTRFPQATVKGFAFWERFCRFVNPNA
jgi:hypothetical protein